MSGVTPHKAKYKNAGLDAQELRRRREEEGVQIRKNKREQQLFKRRNVFNDDSQAIQVNLVKDSMYSKKNLSTDIIKYVHIYIERSKAKYLCCSKGRHGDQF